jgi:hypothetical protein
MEETLKILASNLIGGQVRIDQGGVEFFAVNFLNNYNTLITLTKAS